VRHAIGPFAAPDIIHIAAGLPKTRSGKIMRRILRKVAASEYDGLGDIGGELLRCLCREGRRGVGGVIRLGVFGFRADPEPNPGGQGTNDDDESKKSEELPW
jgi:hypothetical protein